MKIIKYSLGQLQANCYFLIDNDNNCLIFDPADEASFILEELQRRKLKLVAMMATHGHFDHVMAVGEIQQSINVPLYLNRKDRFLLNRLEETAEHFLGMKLYLIKPRNQKSAINNYLVTNYGLRIIETPGHTPGSQSFYFPKEKIIFTGDTLFKQSIGRYDFSYCNKEDLKESLIKLSKLPNDVKVFPGHGEETMINEEKENILHFIDRL